MKKFTFARHYKFSYTTLEKKFTSQSQTFDKLNLIKSEGINPTIYSLFCGEETNEKAFPQIIFFKTKITKSIEANSLKEANDKFNSYINTFIEKFNLSIEECGDLQII